MDNKTLLAALELDRYHNICRKSTAGKQATRSQQLLLTPLIPRRSEHEVIVIHHVIDLPRKLQLEIERHCPINGVSFERIIL